MILAWRHGKTAEEAQSMLQGEIRRLGYETNVSWKGRRAEASVGFGAILRARLHVTEDAVVIEECRGAAATKFLDSVRMSLRTLFPGGA